MKGIKTRLTLMNFLEFAVWGSYLTSMGGFLAKVGLQEYIGVLATKLRTVPQQLIISSR